MSGNVPFSTVGMIGAGSMGSMMSFLMWENGYEVYFLDPNSDSVKRLNQNAANVGAQDKVVEKTDYKSLCSAVKQNPDGLGVFILSIPHGQAADAAVESLRPHLSRGDIIVDCGNEHYANTERRQKELDPAGIHYIGCGVSGGYQSARSGPSFSPGGDPDTLNKLMPFFTQLAAKDGDGQPCTRAVGPGSSGHYVKTVHNGIEQGMMSAVAEAWLLLIRGLGLSYDEASDVFRSWNEHGPLRSCFLIAIGRDILKTKDDRGEQVLAHVRDKVVQDVDDSEGTGVWTCEEAISQHVPAATIVASHLFRDASADAALRMTNRQSTGSEIEPRQLNVSSKESFIQAIEKAIYFSFLTCYIQGFGIIQKKNKSKGWNLNCTDIIQIWRTGTIIEASHVLDVLNEAFKRNECDPEDLLADGGIGAELSYNYPTIKEVVLKAVEADMFVPGLSQSLEYYKYSTSTELPTQFMEAQLDYFGEHMFDRKEDPPGKPQKGSRHFEWKRAKGSVDK